MSAPRPFRTMDDLERTVRALATEFGTDKVFVIGSQAILLNWPDAPTVMTSSVEIDAYPANARMWELEQHKHDPMAEASEHISGIFGYGSQFHQTHGFYIDGVDENTAKLPQGWQERSMMRQFVVGGRSVTAVAPGPEDLIVSKLARLDDKDKAFVEAYHAARPLNAALMEERIRMTDLDPSIAERALAFVRNLTRG